MSLELSDRIWPAGGPARVPNWVYTDPHIFAREQERIFGANLAVCLPGSRIALCGRLQTRPAWQPRRYSSTWE
jgi:hypothetical protein